MKDKLVLEKVQQAINLLNEKNVDLWLIFARESSVNRDPMMEMIVGADVTWQSAFLINRNGDTTAVIGSLEVPAFNMLGTYKNVIGYVKSVKEPLLEYLNKNNPQKIAINYSVNNNLADGLSYGMYLTLMDILACTAFKERLVSSEELVSALKGRKSSTEISFMKQAINQTLEIFNEVTKFIKPGKSEREIGDFIIRKVEERGLDLAWSKDHCPAVFTGPDTAGAHAGPTNRIVEKGHIINIDFGVKVNGYCSDLQRTWYVLQDGETTVPAQVKKGFQVLRESIKQAKAVIKPGIQGCEVDDAARNYITSNGYAEYQHGLGHQVGRIAHDGGGGLFPRWERYGNLPFLPIEENQVYTIEPRLTVAGHGIVTMEEMIVVTKNGCEYLSTPQEELIIID